jgi:hypothetical protein
MRDLNRKVGDKEYDGLITDLNPPIEVRGGTIAGLAAASVYKRGTILAKNTADNKLYILGSTVGTDVLIPHSVLCDDCDVGASVDSNQAVYTAGCFHTEKVTALTGYTISETDYDELRKRNIVFRLPHEAI